jgi:hypothetical protein
MTVFVGFTENTQVLALCLIFNLDFRLRIASVAPRGNASLGLSLRKMTRKRKFKRRFRRE